MGIFGNSITEMKAQNCEYLHNIQSSEMPDRRCGRHWIELFQRKMLWRGLWQKKCISGDSWIMKDWCVKKIVTFENRNMEE